MGVTAEISKQQRHKALQKTQTQLKTSQTQRRSSCCSPDHTRKSSRESKLHLSLDQGDAFTSKKKKKKNPHFVKTTGLSRLSTSGTALSEQEKRGPSQNHLGTPKKKSLPRPSPRRVQWGFLTELKKGISKVQMSFCYQKGEFTASGSLVKAI